jgi:mRNA-degrading endonuclease toxin of MazEF toxin-antitoxin module
VRFSSPDKRRPVLVLGPPGAVSSWSKVPVIPLSSQFRGLPWEVRISSEDGLAVPSVLKPEWISSVERTLLGPWIATLPDQRWPEVRSAVLAALGLD